MFVNRDGWMDHIVLEIGDEMRIECMIFLKLPRNRPMYNTDLGGWPFREKEPARAKTLPSI